MNNGRKTELLGLIDTYTNEELLEAMYMSHVGLQNRRAFEEMGEGELAMVDIDSLKYVNDTYGHRMGDELLKTFAGILGDVFGDHAYHMSGDEFVVEAKTRLELSAGIMKVHDLCNAAVIEHDDLSLLSALKFSVGMGSTLRDADLAMFAHKQAREDRGERVARGSRPPGLVEAKYEVA